MDTSRLNSATARGGGVFSIADVVSYLEVASSSGRAGAMASARDADRSLPPSGPASWWAGSSSSVRPLVKGELARRAASAAAAAAEGDADAVAGAGAGAGRRSCLSSSSCLAALGSLGATLVAAGVVVDDVGAVLRPLVSALDGAWTSANAVDVDAAALRTNGDVIRGTKARCRG